MPSVVFTDPQVASVGLTETAARAQGLDVKVSLLPLDAVPRALAARDTRGLIKLVADKVSDRLLGGQIMAPEGADSIQTLVLTIKHGMTTADLGAILFPYLTTVEGLLGNPVSTADASSPRWHGPGLLFSVSAA